jgi:hypothetical protein
MSSGSNLCWLVLFVSAVLVGSICKVMITDYCAQIDLMLAFLHQGWHE